MTIGKTLRALRERAGLSQRRVATLAGISNTYVGAVEAGQRVPTYATARLLESAVKASPGALTSTLPAARRAS